MNDQLVHTTPVFTQITDYGRCMNEFASLNRSYNEKSTM